MSATDTPENCRDVFKVQTVVTGRDGIQSLVTPKEVYLNVEVEAVNDRPELVNTGEVETPEDTPLLLDGFSITDVDAVLDDPSALGARNSVAAAREILDRTGIVKKEQIEVKGPESGVFILPPKRTDELDNTDET